GGRCIGGPSDRVPGRGPVVRVGVVRAMVAASVPEEEPSAVLPGEWVVYGDAQVRSGGVDDEGVVDDRVACKVPVAGDLPEPVSGDPSQGDVVDVVMHGATGDQRRLTPARQLASRQLGAVGQRLGDGDRERAAAAHPTPEEGAVDVDLG